VAQKDNVEARAGRDLQHPFLPSVVCAILVVGAAIGAIFADGVLQVILIVLAVILSAYTAMLIFTGVLLSVMNNMPKRRERAKRDRPGS